jgi:hypothetical protein
VPTWPVAAQAEQIIMLAGGGSVTPNGNGQYDATIEKSTHALPLTFATKDSVWAVELNGTTPLVGGSLYKARLIDYNNGRPVFGFNSPTSSAPAAPEFWVVPVSTTIAANFNSGSRTVTPAKMDGIFTGANLRIDRGTIYDEIVAVTGTTGSTFTATFAFNHNTPPTLVEASQSTIPGDSVIGYPGAVYDITDTAGAGNVYTFSANGWLLDLNYGSPLDQLPIEPGWSYRCASLGTDSNSIGIFADFSLPSTNAVGISGYTDNFAISGTPANFVLNFNKDGPSYSGSGNVDILWAGFAGGVGLNFHCYGQTQGFSGTLAAAVAGGKSVVNGLITP